MIKSKKSQVLVYGLIFGFFIAIGTFYMASYLKELPDEYLGEKSLNIIKAASEAEKALLYIDLSARYAAYKTLDELSSNGGYSTGSGCGTYLGYNLWNNEEEICYPSKEMVEENFKLLFNDNLNGYLQNYPKIHLPVNNYEVQLSDKLKITGLAISSLEIGIGVIEEFKMIEPITIGPKIDVSYKYQLKGYNRPSGAIVDRIILHHTGDDAASKTYSTLVKRKLSVHYIIDRDGTIYYTVDEAKMAYHAEDWNSRSIGIEIVNTGHKDMEYTQSQYESIKSLINDIADRRSSITVDDEHVIGHYDASEIGKWDPSPNFEWAKIGLPSHEGVKVSALSTEDREEFGYA